MSDAVKLLDLGENGDHFINCLGRGDEGGWNRDWFSDNFVITQANQGVKLTMQEVSWLYFMKILQSSQVGCSSSVTPTYWKAEANTMTWAYSDTPGSKAIHTEAF